MSADVCVDRTEEFRKLAGRSRAVHAAPQRHKLLDASRRAIDKWCAAKNKPGSVPLAQLRRAARFSLQHVLEQRVAVSEQHWRHIELVVLDFLAREKRCGAPAAPPESVTSVAERARTRVLAQLTAPDEYYSERATAMRHVNQDLVRTGELAVRVGALVGEQGELVDRLAHNVESSEARIDAARNELGDAAPRVYRTWRWRARTYCVPHSLTARLRLCLCALIAFNIALFALDII